MMTIPEFARLHSISETTAWKCAKATVYTPYPPLSVKRVARPGSNRPRIYVTAEQAAEWRAALQDA